MSNHIPYFAFGRLIVMLPLLALSSLACSNILSSVPYQESFDSAGNWGVGTTADVEGKVDNGVYEMYVKDNSGIYLASAGENFSILRIPPLRSR